MSTTLEIGSQYSFIVKLTAFYSVFVMAAQPSGEFGLDEWTLDMLNRYVSMYLKYSGNDRKSYHVILMKQPAIKSVKFGHVIEYAQFKHIRDPKLLDEEQL